MALVFIASIISALCCEAAWRRLRELKNASAAWPARRLSREAWLTWAAADPAASPARDWVLDVLQARSRTSAVARLNEQTRELARLTESSLAVPRALGRVALASGVMCAIVQIALQLPATESTLLQKLLLALAAAVAGALGAAACAYLGQLAGKSVQNARDRWRHVREQLTSWLPTE